jgi:hypothetical protein
MLKRITTLAAAGAGVIGLGMLCLAGSPANAATATTHHYHHPAVTAGPDTCSQITDNGGAGQAIINEGAGNAVETTTNGEGDCYTPINTTYNSNLGLYLSEYRNGDGDCLNVDHSNAPGIVTAATCTSGDGYEEFWESGNTDSSGNSGYNLYCLGVSSDTSPDDGCFYSNEGAENETAMCAEDSGTGSYVSMVTGLSAWADRCVWHIQ